MTAAAARRRAEQTALGGLVAHPLRCELLIRFADRTASPTELAHELLKDVRTVSYHVRALVAAGAIEEVRHRRVRGSIETFYRATTTPFFDTEGFTALSGPERRRFAQHIFFLVTAAATTSIETGRLFERPDAHISRVPIACSRKCCR